MVYGGIHDQKITTNTNNLHRKNLAMGAKTEQIHNTTTKRIPKTVRKMA